MKRNMSVAYQICLHTVLRIKGFLKKETEKNKNYNKSKRLFVGENGLELRILPAVATLDL